MMSIVRTINKRNIRKAVISFVLLAITVLTFASIGGGNTKLRNNLIPSNIAPVRTNRGFSLRNGMTYRGSMMLNEQRNANSVSFNALTIYQKGNATYIIPNKYRVSVSQNSTRSNLQMFNLKFKLCK